MYIYSASSLLTFMFANDTAWLASNGNIKNLFEDANTELS